MAPRHTISPLSDILRQPSQTQVEVLALDAACHLLMELRPWPPGPGCCLPEWLLRTAGLHSHLPPSLPVTTQSSLRCFGKPCLEGRTPKESPLE